MKICIILAYYGALPKYFSLYLQSLQRMNFRVILVTDIAEIDDVENLSVVRMALKDVELLAERKLGTKVCLSTNRRLCDFKPMYGKIFEDYLTEYDYWGFGDCDLIYGYALRDVVEHAVSKGFDLISLRRHWITGSFCLIKNNDKCRMLYARANNWKDIACATLDKCLDFDELGGKWHQQVESGMMTISDCHKYVDSFTAIVWRSNDLNVFHEDCIWETNLKHDYVHIQADGRLIINGREKHIVHFVNCKGRRYFVVPTVPTNLPNDYRITDTGFYYNNLIWAFRPIVSIWRKCVAIFVSFSYNGPKHLLDRLYR